MRSYIITIFFFFFVFILPYLSGWVDAEGVESSGGDNDIAPMLKGEKEALYSAIQGFVGDWWNGSQLYPDPCGWTPIQGVSCDNFNGYWYITTITLGPIHDNSLTCYNSNTQNRTEETFQSLFKLTHLKSLTFFNCFSSPTILPKNWIPLTNTLQSLEFRSNTGLTGTIPTHAFTSLVNLESLVLLNNNHLSGEIPGEIGHGLPKLKKLVLSGNNLTGEIPYSVGEMTELLILDLSRNELSGPIPYTVGQLPLMKLDLSGNMLSGWIPREVGRMCELKLLDLSGNNLSGGGLRWVERMESVVEVVLSGNVNLGGELESVDEWGIRVPNLVVLGLSNVGLNGGLPIGISEMKKLRWLDLSENRIGGEVPVVLAEMGDLNAVYLNGNMFEGKLRFNGSFYERLGRRFRVDGNPNLCYEGGSYSSVGVERCGTRLYDKIEDGGGVRGGSEVVVMAVTERSSRITSTSSSGGGVSVIVVGNSWWWGFLMGSFMMVC